LKHGFASPGLHTTSAAGQVPAGRGVPATHEHECTCGGRTTHEAAKQANFATVQGLRPTSVGHKSSEPLLAEAHRLQSGADAAERAYDPRGAAARKKPSEALLAEAREPQLPVNTSFAVAPGSHGISTHPQETSDEPHTVSRGKRPSPPTRKPKDR
jgi:hypothetical protein